MRRGGLYKRCHKPTELIALSTGFNFYLGFGLSGGGGGVGGTRRREPGGIGCGSPGEQGAGEGSI